MLKSSKVHKIMSQSSPWNSLFMSITIDVDLYDHARFYN